MKNIPFLLIYSRIVLAVLIAVLAISRVEEAAILIVVFTILGLLTDVFDGIVARKLNVSTEKLRRWDSNVDQFFWLLVIGSVFYLNVEFISENFYWVFLILFLEILCYGISFWKFKKTVATHSILAKLWTLTLLAFLIDLLLNSESHFLFILCVAMGVLSRVEIMLIILELDKWTTDVPSLFSVSKINKGEKIKKNKFFNS